MPRDSTKINKSNTSNATQEVATTNDGTYKPVTLHNHRSSNTGLKRQTKLIQFIHGSKCIIYNMITNLTGQTSSQMFSNVVMIAFEKNCEVNEILDKKPNNIPSHHHKHRIPHGSPPLLIEHNCSLHNHLCAHGNAQHPIDHTNYLSKSD